MVDIPSRHRPLALLAIVVLAQVLLLAFQIKRQQDVRLIRLWSVELLTPLQRAGTWVFRGTGGGWHHYVDLRNATVENERLRAELGRLELRNRELESRAAEQERLAKLLNFRETHGEVPMLAAQVIGAGADTATRTVFINRGERDGVRRNMPVITPEGIVGKTVEAYPFTAQVLLITDKESGVGVLLAASRTHGVIKGTGEPLARLDYVVNDEKVAAGDEVLTSGDDRIFPKDLPAGIVVDTQPGSPFKVIRVQPAARLDRLEDVLVLLARRESLTKTESETAAAKPAPTSPAAKPKATPPATGKPAATSASAPPAGAPTTTPPGATKPAANSAAGAGATASPGGQQNTATGAGSSAAPGKKVPPAGTTSAAATRKKKPPSANKPSPNAPAKTPPADAKPAPPAPSADKPAETPPPETKPPALPQPRSQF